MQQTNPARPPIKIHPWRPNYLDIVLRDKTRSAEAKRFTRERHEARRWKGFIA